MPTLTEVIPTSSVEEDLEAFARCNWEVSVWAADGSDFCERQPLETPPSINRVVWPIGQEVILCGWRIWRDGEQFPDRHFEQSMVFRPGDRLILTLSLSVG
jgi:hypothetical protein